MHEQSLVRNLLSQVDEIRRKHDAQRVTEVRVGVGPLSGVEPLLLASAFDLLKSGTAAASAVLIVDEASLLAKCDACDCDFEIEGFRFRCPTCNGSVKVVSGNQCQLVSVDVSKERNTAGSDGLDHE